MLNASLIRPCAIIRSLFCAKLDLLEQPPRRRRTLGRAHGSNAQEAQQAKTQPVDFRLSRMDLFGLRYIALLFATMGVLFGSLSRVADLAISPASAMQMPNAITWEGWVTPPDYTGLPQLYLNDLTDRDELELLAGSSILIHFYGAVGDHILTETVSRRIQDVPPATDQKQELTIAQAGEIAITGQNAQVWTVTLRADESPTVTLDQAFEKISLVCLSWAIA